MSPQQQLKKEHKLAKAMHSALAAEIATSLGSQVGCDFRNRNKNRPGYIGFHTSKVARKNNGGDFWRLLSSIAADYPLPCATECRGRHHSSKSKAFRPPWTDAPCMQPITIRKPMIKVRTTLANGIYKPAMISAPHSISGRCLPLIAGSMNGRWEARMPHRLETQQDRQAADGKA